MCTRLAFRCTHNVELTNYGMPATYSTEGAKNIRANVSKKRVSDTVSTAKTTSLIEVHTVSQGRTPSAIRAFQLAVAPKLRVVHILVDLHI